MCSSTFTTPLVAGPDLADAIDTITERTVVEGLASIARTAHEHTTVDGAHQADGAVGRGEPVRRRLAVVPELREARARPDEPACLHAGVTVALDGAARRSSLAAGAVEGIGGLAQPGADLIDGVPGLERAYSVAGAVGSDHEIAGVTERRAARVVDRHACTGDARVVGEPDASEAGTAPDTCRSAAVFSGDRLRSAHEIPRAIEARSAEVTVGAGLSIARTRCAVAWTRQIEDTAKVRSAVEGQPTTITVDSQPAQSATTLREIGQVAG